MALRDLRLVPGPTRKVLVVGAVGVVVVVVVVVVAVAVAVIAVAVAFPVFNSLQHVMVARAHEL